MAPVVNKSVALHPENLAEEDDSLVSPAEVNNPAINKSYITRGTRRFTHATLALFCAGLSTFAVLYCVQPILPVFSQSFHLTPAQSSLSLSVTTVMMALGLLVTGPLSDAIGRKSVMSVSLLLAALFTLMCAAMTSWQGVLAMRALTGLALSGVAAVAMTWLSEELHPVFLSFSMGLYISGNSIGGLVGRLSSGMLADHFSWNVSLLVVGLFALAAAGLFFRLLPASQHFRPSSLRPRKLLINFMFQWRDMGLPMLFLVGFVLMGSFVTLFNYVSYRFLSAPFSLSQTVVGLLSVVYLTGTWSSPRAGMMTVRYGRGVVLIGALCLMLTGLIATQFTTLFLVLPGLMLFAAGFFAAHSVASSWVGHRARRARGQASSLYLFFYYLGSSVAGTLGGVFWHGFGWPGVSAFIAVMLIAGLVLANQLRKIPVLVKKVR
ncbi:MFS transporter [Erwinia papayae]|uniref:Membrane protein n=2 Tax=Erwinia TaxID=551 RepID=A0A014ND76_9GAMM|nr:MFS transporter [Erwinia mallotivora]EXU77368.1 membrane protein [Erwinia mallotivora]